MTANDHDMRHSELAHAAAIVPRSGETRPHPFDPTRADRLMRQGLDFLLVRELTDAIEPDAAVPDATPADGDDPAARCTAGHGTALPAHAFELLIQELAAAMVPSVSALVGDAEHLMRKQQTLALACIHACLRSRLPPDCDARHQLGLLTDVVSDEHRFPWWRALPLQVALNICGDGNGGFRTLYGNLSHPNETIRRHLLPIAWMTRRRLDPERLCAAIGPGLATNDHWATALAVLRGATGDRDTFLRLLADVREQHGAPVIGQRVAGVTGGDAALTAYVAAPADLLAIERKVRAEVLRAATTRPGPLAQSDVSGG